MKKAIIIGGAPIDNYERLKNYISDEDFAIYCDSGLNHLEKLQKQPNLIIGDFDSHKNPCIPIETIVLPCEKDDTDTVFAIKEAIKRGFDEFLLLGVVGLRLDHTLGNVYILSYLEKEGKKGKIVDDFSEMEIVSKEPKFVESGFSYFSLINISGTAKGINIENAKYPLKNAKITTDYQYGVSNEVLPEKTAKISVNEGNLLLIKVFKQ